MNSRRIGFGGLLVVMLASVMLVGGIARGETAMEQMVVEGDSGWLLGRWVASTDEGEVTLVYRWTLEKNAIAVYFKMGDYSYQGMIYVVPGEEKVAEMGIDSKGGITKSEWDVTWDGLVSKREVKKVDGGTDEMGLVSSKVDKDTMKMKVYGIEWGSLANDPMATIDFKRKPMQRQPMQRRGTRGSTRTGTRTRNAAATE